jgi:hypothetical protein
MKKRIRNIDASGSTELPEPAHVGDDDEFDVLLARMQTPIALAGMKAAFNATPRELGQAASAAMRKRTPST